MTEGSDRSAGPVAPVRGATSGFSLLFEGMRLLRRRRELWGLASIPVGFAFVAVAAAIAGIVGYAGEIHEGVAGWLPVLEAGAWYTWIWIGPARLLMLLVGWILFAFVVGAMLVLSLLVANIASAPFLDALSQRVERIESGAVFASDESGLSAVVFEIGRTVANEAQRVGFFVALWAAIFILGVVIPGGALVASPALVALTILFLPLDYAGPILDRRQVPFRVRRAWIRGNLPAVLGFGGAAFLVSLVPGLNLVLLPVLVVGGTLLALRHPPPGGLTGS